MRYEGAAVLYSHKVYFCFAKTKPTDGVVTEIEKLKVKLSQTQPESLRIQATTFDSPIKDFNKSTNFDVYIKLMWLKTRFCP